MTPKLRLGVIGANMHSNWAPRSHFPALAVSPDWEIAAVCTTRMETAEEARAALGARLAFDDYRKMVQSPEVDAVVVVVRVPSHFEPTRAALEAGKHVFTEWPLGRTTAEAETLAALARAKGLRTMVGLQSRVSPVIMYMKELIESGWIGKVVTCHLSFMRGGQLRRRSDRTWQRDASLGANTFTISHGHAVDALRFVAGDFARVGAMVTTQVPQWLETDTQRLLDVTAPDNVLVNGWLDNGAVASVHVAAVPWADSGLRMEIYGTEGTLLISGPDAPQNSRVVLQGARGSDPLASLEIPARLHWVPAATPQGAAYNVGQLYHCFARAIREGAGGQPDFDTAVRLHRFLDDIQKASESGRSVDVRGEA